MTKIRYTVSGPTTPGATPMEITRCRTIAAARRVARERFTGRRDLHWQDVRIDHADDGRLAEYADPAG